MKTEYGEKYKKLGLSISYYRKLRGYTQEQLAERVGISWSFLAQVESPNTVRGISLETLFKIADILEIPPRKLLAED